MENEENRFKKGFGYWEETEIKKIIERGRKRLNDVLSKRISET